MAVCFYNNLSHPSFQGLSPNEVYGDQSDICKICTFGSKALGLQHQELLNRLEERSSKGLFVGFDPVEYKILGQKEAQHAGIGKSEEDDAPSFMEYEDQDEFLCSSHQSQIRGPATLAS
jgi:hypothetical protein